MDLIWKGILGVMRSQGGYKQIEVKAIFSLHPGSAKLYLFPPPDGRTIRFPPDQCLRLLIRAGHSGKGSPPARGPLPENRHGKGTFVHPGPDVRDMAPRTASLLTELSVVRRVMGKGKKKGKKSGGEEVES